MKSRSAKEISLLLDLLCAARDYVSAMRYQIPHKFQEAVEACDEISINQDVTDDERTKTDY